MAFASERDAKQFLISKAVAEAIEQHMPLPDVEVRLLGFNESEPQTDAGIPEDLLADEGTEFEEKIKGLLRAAYQRDRDNPDEREKYGAALRQLKSCDDYILVMAVPALAQATRGRDLLRFALIVFAVAIALIAYAFWRAQP
jgi:hypothetical protein